MNGSHNTYNNIGYNKMGNYQLNLNRALIVDDEIDICFLLKGILKHLNIEADYATNLSEASQILEKSDPPVIFLDNHLSDGLGIDYISKVKEGHPHSKIIMITAHDTASDRQKAYSEGIDYFIGKPFTRDTIIKTVEKIKENSGE